MLRSLKTTPKLQHKSLAALGPGAPDEPVFVQPPGEFLECPICTDVPSPPTEPLANRPLTLCLYQVLSEASLLACGRIMLIIS